MPPRSLRKKRVLDELEEGGAAAETKGVSIDDIKLLQKQRQKHAGLDAESLLSGNLDVAFTEDTEESGELDNAFKREQKLQVDPTSMAMERFVEKELAARLGRSAEEDSKPDSSASDVYVSDDFKRREEKEANAAWISGIAEVPLSVEERIRNVEATELAKNKMLAEAGLAIPGKDEEEDFGGSKGLRRGLYPPNFGKQDSAAKERIKNAQYAREANARARAHHAAQRAKKRAEDHPNW